MLDRAGELAAGERRRHLAVELAEKVLVHAVEDDKSLPVLRARVREIVSRTNEYIGGQFLSSSAKLTSSFPTTIMLFLIG